MLEDKEMKKEYLEPQIKIILDTASVLLSGSGGVTGNLDGNDEIGYGGVDEEGTIDPEAKPGIIYSVWKDDASKKKPNTFRSIWDED